MRVGKRARESRRGKEGVASEQRASERASYRERERERKGREREREGEREKEGERERERERERENLVPQYDNYQKLVNGIMP